MFTVIILGLVLVISNRINSENCWSAGSSNVNYSFVMYDLASISGRSGVFLIL